jgi:L-threonylcarbamoyladenylate synthase
VNIDAIGQAADVISRGGVVAYPTEAVYGLGCDPLNEKAIRRLLQIKRRPVGKGLILIAARFSQLEGFIDPLPESTRTVLFESWPGPVTWLVPAKGGVPITVRGDHKTLAVRVTAHPVACALCERLNQALISTSANVSGAQPARSSAQVLRMFGNQIDYILEGPVDMKAEPTQIRDALSGKIIRRGS